MSSTSGAVGKYGYLGIVTYRGSDLEITVDLFSPKDATFAMEALAVP